MGKKKDDHMDNWTWQDHNDYPHYTGAATESVSVDGMQWSFGDLDVTYDNEEVLRDKYPALKQAWEHYLSVKKMCESKEKENED